MSSSSDNFSGSCGHMCHEQTCVLRTSLSLYNFRRRFLGCSHYKVSPNWPFFVWLDNPTCPHRNETAPLALERMSRLQSAFQLANERERIALKMIEEARQMTEKALKEEVKTKERERKAQAICAKVKENAMFAEEKQRMWNFACIFCHGSFLLLLCCCRCVLAQLSSLEWRDQGYCPEVINWLVEIVMAMMLMNLHCNSTSLLM